MHCLVRSSVVSGCLALASASCERASTPVVLGAAGAWHYPDAEPTRQGIQLAVEEINLAGGIRGRPLEVVFRDDSAKGVRAVAVAQQFVADRRILGVIGHLNSGTFIAAAKVYHGNLAAVSPTAVSPELTGLSEWMFRLMPSDSSFGEWLAHFATTISPRAGIIYDNNSYGRGGAEAFSRQYPGTLIGSDPIRPDSPRVEPHMTWFRERGAGLIYVATNSGSALAVLREAKRQQYAGRILGTESWIFMLTDTAAAEGALIGMRFTLRGPRPAARQFATRFATRFGRAPPENGFAAYAYDATRLLARAIEERGPDRGGVRDYLASLDGGRTYPGVTGPIRFQRNGDPYAKPFVMMQVRRGALVPVPSAVPGE